MKINAWTPACRYKTVVYTCSDNNHQATRIVSYISSETMKAVGMVEKLAYVKQVKELVAPQHQQMIIASDNAQLLVMHPRYIQHNASQIAAVIK